MAEPKPGDPSLNAPSFDPGPISPGPLRFDSAALLDVQSSPYGVTDAILSPDGTAVARWHGGAPAPVEIVQIGRPGRVEVPNQVTFRSFTLLSMRRGPSSDALAWSSDSRMLWSVRQETVKPNGWALGGLEPIMIGRDGTVGALPALRHSAGPLDGLQWVGGKGEALALFGAKGGYYRPEHDDPEPTLAMVDASRGRLLDSIRARSLAALRRRMDAHGVRFAGAAATLLGDGRICTVIQFGRWSENSSGAGSNRDPIVHPPVWLYWTQGEQPLERRSPYPEDSFNHLVLTSGGTRLLVLRPLQADGTQIKHRAPPCRQRPPPRPVTGSIAELIEVSSGRVLWRLRRRVDRFWNQNASPAVSGDGRFALIALPPEDDRLPIALVDMRNGRIVQTMAPAHVGSYAYALGFTEDGRRAWVAVHNRMIFYEFDGG